MRELLAALDPHRRSRRIKQALGVATVIAAVGITAAVTAPDEAAPCDEGVAEMATHWSDARSTGLRDRIAASGSTPARVRAEATIRALDDYAREWAAAYDAACRVRTEPPTPEDRRRHVCLMRGRESVASVVALFGEGAALDSASDLARMLVDPGACERQGSAAVDELLADRERIPEVIEILAAVDRAHFERLVGRFPQAVALGEEAATRAREVGAPHLLGTALVEYGAARLYAGEHDVADALLREAFEQAIVARDPALQAEVAGRQVQIEERRGGNEACVRWYGIARAALRAGGVEGRPAVALAINYAHCRENASDLEGARALLEDAFARCRQLDPPDDLLCGDVAHNLGTLDWREEKIARAEEYLDLAESLWPDDLERSDPRSVAVLTRRTIAAERRGDLATAARLTHEAFEIHRDSRGPSHPDTVYRLLMSAVFEALLGHEERARAKLEEASASVDEPGAEHPLENHVMMYAVRALIHEGRGELDRQVAEFDALLRLAPEDATEIRGTFELSRAAALVVMGRSEEAETELEAMAGRGEPNTEIGRETLCWWSIAAAARGAPETARARLDRGSRIPEGLRSAWGRSCCEVATLAVEEHPDPDEVDAVLARARHVRPVAEAVHDLFARLLRGP